MMGQPGNPSPGNTPVLLFTLFLRQCSLLNWHPSGPAFDSCKKDGRHAIVQRFLWFQCRSGLSMKQVGNSKEGNS
eukprot:scaffold1194_cov127-Cylindrotheca_fusiformis.AAC.9